MSEQLPYRRKEPDSPLASPYHKPRHGSSTKSKKPIVPSNPEYRGEGRLPRSLRNPDEISLTSEDTQSVASDVSIPDITISTAPARSQKQEMSKPVLFYGKPSQVDDVVTFCTVKFLADGTSEESQKAGYLASLFRGPALSWLTTYLATNELVDYEELVQQIKKNFGLSETAQAGLYARQLANLRQKSSVQAYGLEFSQLSGKVGLPEAAATAQFIKGLKPHIQRSLVASDDYKTLEDAITEATRIDSELYNIGRQSGYQGNKRGYGKSRDKQGRFKSHNFKYEQE